MTKPKTDELLTEIEETPTVMIRTTYYSNKKTGEFLGMKHEYQDKDGMWITL